MGAWWVLLLVPWLQSGESEADSLLRIRNESARAIQTALRKGGLDEARPVLGELMATSPPEAWPVFSLASVARALAQSGESDKAYTLLALACHASPSGPTQAELLMDMVGVLEVEGHPFEARQVLLRAFEESSTCGAAHLLSLQALAEERWWEALEWIAHEEHVVRYAGCGNAPDPVDWVRRRAIRGLGGAGDTRSLARILRYGVPRAPTMGPPVDRPELRRLAGIELTKLLWFG